MAAENLSAKVKRFLYLFLKFVGEILNLGGLGWTRATAFGYPTTTTVQFVAPTISEVASEEGFKRIVPQAIRNPSIANMLDRCAISTPCHHAGELLVGLSLMGEHGNDRRILAIGLSVEIALRNN